MFNEVNVCHRTYKFTEMQSGLPIKYLSETFLVLFNAGKASIIFTTLLGDFLNLLTLTQFLITVSHEKNSRDKHM